MSNNARVVEGGEIGTAQYLQAVAAGVRPDVRMNPVLVKPETETTSQVILLGRADPQVSAMSWRARAPELWSTIETSLHSLMDEYDVVVIEGAGSPAEINLRDTDLANMPVARAADAPVLLASDIDRGGALAHLYGTWALLDEADQQRVAGFILNKFRGDVSLLEPAPTQLQNLTGVPTLGVVPMVHHGLPDEDGAAPPTASASGPRVAIVRYPTGSNLDEFKLLEQVGSVVWVSDPADLEGADLVILPGSKHVSRDLAWLRQLGLDQAICAHADRGGRIIGVCGGMQMLGTSLVDESGRDGSFEGLGLLPQRTTLVADKLLARSTSARFGELAEPWAALAGFDASGYEIRHGRSEGPAAILGEDLGWVCGPVLGFYMHGLFEDPQFVKALTGKAPADDLDTIIDKLADSVLPHLNGEALNRLAGVG